MFCKTCPHYQEPDKYRMHGECHSGPPAVSDANARWPLVALDDWCSHHPERQMATAQRCQEIMDRHNALIDASEAGKAN